MIIAVTGSTGSLGSLVLKHLLKKVSPSSLVAIARNEAKAADLKSKGIQIRQASYEDSKALEKAFEGVDRVLLVSSNEVGKRFSQHKAVIDAAKKAGVKLLAYTSLIQADTSVNPLAAEHKATEEYIRNSGLPYVFLRNNWYTENFVQDARFAKDSGIIAAAVGNAKVASAARTDYAEAAANVLIGSGHENKTYELSGNYAWDYKELAKTIGEIYGRSVNFVDQTEAEKKKALLDAKLPEGTADFVVALDKGIGAGSLSLVSKDLTNLLGHTPLSLKEALKAALA